jgi:hypothetical protein
MKPKDLEKLTKTDLLARVKTAERRIAKLSKTQAGLVGQLRDLEAENGALSLRIQELETAELAACGAVSTEAEHDAPAETEPLTEAELADALGVEISAEVSSVPLFPWVRNEE